MGGRFAEERGRLRLGVQALADICGVTRQQISRVERGDNAPGGDLLALFATAGADPGYILNGVRSRLIDLQLLAVCEAALREAYGSMRGEMPGPIRARITASLYNMVLGSLKPGDDDTSLAMAQASQFLHSLDDPADPELLRRNLFVSKSDSDSRAGVAVTGDHNRVAGRDMIERGKGRKG